MAKARRLRTAHFWALALVCASPASAATVSWTYQSYVNTEPVGGANADPLELHFSYRTDAPIRYSDASQTIYGDVFGTLQVGSNLVQFSNGLLTVTPTLFSVEICRSCAFVPGLKAIIEGDVYGRIFEYFNFLLRGNLFTTTLPPTSIDQALAQSLSQDFILRGRSGILNIERLRPPTH
jgi:hypothetical protein